ncbi:ABC transporter permease [Alkalihalobacillus pseudalcaliphilus]|uniref:ABC transporter permease n=1 Tax=Alkalihalobacillus pseudalcaliphilus TaxID=79884 RepID=UPI00064DF963|nr:ABC transporter permease [Alkalihalobacillus pseudalcaliphilus]KMK76776.1 hypothetical protein AB990_07630 [Alkalihalobacillus pseudalcaliphilus]
MISFLKKDLLVFWRDRKEVLISLLAPILIIIVLNFVFSGITFDDAGDMDIRAGLVMEDNEAAGIEQFIEVIWAMDLSEIEKETMIKEAESLSPSGLITSFFNEPELSSWIHTQELSEKEAVEQVKNGDLDAIIKIPEGFMYDFLAHMMLGQPAQAALHVQLEDHSIEANILTDMLTQYMETLNFQIALGAVAEVEGAELTLPQGGLEIINERAVEIDLAQYFTIAMSSLFALFIASTVASKTATEKRENVFNRILLTNSQPLSYLMGKITSTFFLVWIQLMLVFLCTDLLLGIFSEQSIAFWLGIMVIVTLFSLTVAGLSAIFTSLMLKMNNINAANGLFIIVVMVIGALGGNFFPMEQFPAWAQAVSVWTPTGITVSLFTDFLQYGQDISFVAPLMKQFAFFVAFLLIGILLFPERGRA